MVSPTRYIYYSSTGKKSDEQKKRLERTLSTSPTDSTMKARLASDQTDDEMPNENFAHLVAMIKNLQESPRV